jgi:hypothetical protein
MLDFETVKQILIADVVERFGVKLSNGNKWRYGTCPLPSHDPNKLRESKFGINVEKNYWTCFSASCKERRNGQEWGDGINLVTIMEGIPPLAAAERLAEWFLIPKEAEPEPPPAAEAKPDSYMKQVDVWFDELVKRTDGEDDAAYLKRLRNGIKAKLIESYRSGLAKSAA